MGSLFKPFFARVAGGCVAACAARVVTKLACQSETVKERILVTPTSSIRLKLETIRANFTLVGGALKAIGTTACAGIPIDVLVAGAGETDCVSKGEVI